MENKKPISQWIEVEFNNPIFNYSTNVSVEATESEIKRYFIGNWFDRGEYPKEDFHKCINVVIHKNYEEITN